MYYLTASEIFGLGFLLGMFFSCFYTLIGIFIYFRKGVKHEEKRIV